MRSFGLLHLPNELVVQLLFALTPLVIRMEAFPDLGYATRSSPVCEHSVEEDHGETAVVSSKHLPGAAAESGTARCARRAREDHPFCRRCSRALTTSVRAQSLSRPPVPEPKDERQLQAGRLLANLAAIEQLGFKLDALKDIRASLWDLLRGR